MALPAYFNIGYQKSIELLQATSTSHGFLASKNAVSNYLRIWTRDATVTGLASLLTGEDDLIRTFRKSIETVFNHQHPVGFIPSNVDPVTEQSSYGGTVGRTDNVCWAPIGLLSYVLHTGDTALAKTYQKQIEKCFDVLDIWEYNGKGLVYTPQSGDWADEYVQHGYTLFNQLLRVWALKLAAKVYQDESYQIKAHRIRELIQTNFWKHDESDNWYAPNMAHQIKDIPGGYWLMGFNPARIYSQFDLQANSLALLMDIGTVVQQQAALHWIISYIHQQKNMLPSFYPSLKEGDILYEDLKNNYAYEFRNYPNEFHNGGLWQVWNGWLCAALVKCNKLAEATQVLNFIQEANFKNADDEPWGFYENCHGISFAPIGVQHCTWSAAGQIIAHQYLNGKEFLI